VVRVALIAGMVGLWALGMIPPPQASAAQDAAQRQTPPGTGAD